MSEHRDELLIEIEQSLFGLSEEKLQRVCVHSNIAGKDREKINGKNRRALIKHIVEYCES